jgi:isopenicillin-N epimerase
VRWHWRLDPDVAFLNHGSYGATPIAVLEEQARLRAELERQPLDFFLRSLPERLQAAKAPVAELLGADPASVAFVPNATTAIATVLHSLRLGPDDEVVASDHVYGAALRAIRARGCQVVIVPLDLDDPDPGATLLAQVRETTSLVVIDQITSPTAWRLPVEQVVRGCRDRGVPCLVDAAHAPGAVDLDLEALDADFWTGNLHKWGYSAKGSAVLVVREELRDRIQSPVVSHFDGFPAALEWTGTADPTAHLSAPVALNLLHGWGLQQVRDHGAEQVRAGAELLVQRCGATLPLHQPGALMVLVDLGLGSLAEAEDLREQLRADGVEVAATTWRGRGYLRLSGAAYNDSDDYERLATSLERNIS